MAGVREQETAASAARQTTRDFQCILSQHTLRTGALFREAETVRLDASIPLLDQSPETLWPILRRNRFDGALLCPWRYTREETSQHLELASRVEWLRGVCGAPGAPDHPRLVAIEARWPNVEAIHEATARGLMAEVACGMLSLGAVARFAAGHPRARITVLRAGGARFEPAGPARPDPVWEDGMAQLAACPNVRVKINGLLNDAPPGDAGGSGPSSVGWRVEWYKPWVAEVLRLFGAGRAMYGSDWPVSLAKGASWKESLACFTQSMGPRTMAYREAVLGGTAEEWYGIPNG